MHLKIIRFSFILGWALTFGCTAQTPRNQTGYIQPIRISPGNPESSIGKLAIDELRCYYNKIFTNPVDTSGMGLSFDLVAGTPEL